MAASSKKPSVEPESIEETHVEPEAYTAAEVRVILHCSKEFLNKEFRSWRLRSLLRGNNRMFNRSSLDAYMAMTEAEGLKS